MTSNITPDAFATRAIHAGQHFDPTTGAVIPPIYQSSTFVQDGIGGLRGGYEYARAANPTRTALEQQLAAPFDGPTVVVTHHAPHSLSVAPRFASDWATCGFASALSDSFFEVPVLWIHGYTHTTFDYRVGNCRVVCNPRGYKLWGGDFEVDDFDPALVIEVKP